MSWKLRAVVSVVDKGWQPLRKALKELKGPQSVKAGVFGDGKQRTDGSVKNLDLALIHEFGTETIPARSFVLSTFQAKRREYVTALRGMIGQIYRGKLPIAKALGQLGARMASDMRRRIRDGLEPPLKAATIARKGSSVPLVDTGQLLNSLSWKLEGGRDHGHE